jgi:hypothetical protein
MKHRIFDTLVTCLVAVLLMVYAGGCASQTPTQTALDAHTAYNVVLSGLTEARHAGLISETVKVQIEKVRAPSYDAILALDAAALADDPTASKSAYQRFMQFLPALQKYLIQFQKPPPAPLK